MNWVNSSLQLAGTLLESVDQHAALTLNGGNTDAEDAVEEQGLLSSLKKGITRATESAQLKTTTTTDSEDESGTAVNATEPRRNMGGEEGEGGASSSIIARSPPGSASSARSARSPPLQTPPHSGRLQSTPSSSSSSSSTTTTTTTTIAAALVPSSSSSDAENTRFKKEISKLKSELRLKDQALGKHQQSIQVLEEEIEALERECKDRLAEAQQEMAQLRMEKDTDEKNFVEALELKEAQLQTLQADYTALQEMDTGRSEEIELLRAEIARAEESKDSLWTNASSASQQSEQVVVALRLELQEAQTSLSHAKREWNDSKRTMFERQSQLEKTNAELSTTVASLERELVKLKEQAGWTPPASQDVHTTGGRTTTAAYTQLQEEYRKVQQSLIRTKKALHDESRKSEIHSQEVLSLTHDVKRLQDALVHAQDEASRQAITLTKTNAELRDKLTQWEATSFRSDKTQDADARIQTLTNRLIEKQESIDALRSKITTLEVRLTDAQRRCAVAEDKLAQIERNGGVLGVDMMELGTPVGRKPGARARSNRMASTISRVAPVVERSTRVVTALDVLDKWLLFLGRVFLSMPLARLALLGYLALLHFWVFMVLSFHTSHLNEEVHEGNAGATATAKGHGLGAPGLFPDGMQVPP